MKHFEAFNITLKEFGIKAVELEKKTGIRRWHISKYRNGHVDISASFFVDLILALPPQAQHRFWSLCQATCEL